MLSKLFRGFSGIIREILVIQIKLNRFKTQPRKLVTMSPIPQEKISVCQITFFDRLQGRGVVLVNTFCYGTFYCSNAQFPNIMKLTCIMLLSFFGIMDESILSLASLRLLLRGEWKASWWIWKLTVMIDSQPLIFRARFLKRWLALIQG